MSDLSPMMRRVKAMRYGKIAIPRKGRIRLILICLTLLVVIKIVIFVIKPGTQKTGKKDKAVKSRIADTSQKIKTGALSYEDVVEIAKVQPFNLTKNKDTISIKGKELIRHISLDTTLQALGTRLMKMYKPKYGAIVAIHPGTGRIVSLISFCNDTCPFLGNDLYCKSIFPAASVYKTITAAAAIEKGNYTSQSLMKHIGRKSTLYRYQLEKDLRSFQEIPLEEAFAFSINPVFARLGMYGVGPDAVIEYGQKFGFNTTVPFELANEPSKLSSLDSQFTIAELASGFNEKTILSPLLGALIASAVSEKGVMPRPYLFDSIAIKNDSCIYRAEIKDWRKPIKESTAKELRNMMQSVARYGTARKSFKTIRQSSQFDNFEYGGKTGSVDKDTTGRVDWFVGFARNPADKDQRIAIGAVTVHGAYWTVHSSYLAEEYFRAYLKSLIKKELEKNKTLVTSKVAHHVDTK
jgi:cell division protein FtsI/penicillin-binding protein 2